MKPANVQRKPTGRRQRSVKPKHSKEYLQGFHDCLEQVISTCRLMAGPLTQFLPPLGVAGTMPAIPLEKCVCGHPLSVHVAGSSPGEFPPCLAVRCDCKGFELLEVRP